MSHKLSLLALSLCVYAFCQQNAHAGLPVFDAAALSESITQRILEIEQWARDNSHNANQLMRLDTTNQTLDGTQNLMAKNYEMANKQTWQQVTALQEDSLSLLYASKALWEEFGSASQYYASFQKAAAWDRCLQSNHCNFNLVLSELEDSSISQARQAYEHAEAMNQKLTSQINKLQALSYESEQNQSEAGTLDALSKINGVVASSMVDLNSQLALLTKLNSHALAKESNQTLMQESYFKEATSYQSGAKQSLPIELP